MHGAAGGSSSHALPVPMSVSMSRANIMRHVSNSSMGVPLGAAVHPGGAMDAHMGSMQQPQLVPMHRNTGGPMSSQDADQAYLQQQALYADMHSGALHSHALRQMQMQMQMQYSPTVPMPKLQLSHAEYQAVQAAQMAHAHADGAMSGALLGVADGGMGVYNASQTGHLSQQLVGLLPYMQVGDAHRSVPGMVGGGEMLSSQLQAMQMQMGMGMGMALPEAVEAPHEPPEPPERALAEVIGRGGFGSVYKGVWRGQRVAVKLLSIESEEMRQVGADWGCWGWLAAVGG